MNRCPICEVDWDPQTQLHRTGPDCVSGLKNLICSEELRVKKLHMLFQKYADDHDGQMNGISSDLKRCLDELKELSDRVTTLATRVNVIEHPELRKVPSIKARVDKE